jgi:hypothetical protein
MWWCPWYSRHDSSLSPHIVPHGRAVLVRSIQSIYSVIQEAIGVVASFPRPQSLVVWFLILFLLLLFFAGKEQIIYQLVLLPKSIRREWLLVLTAATECWVFLILGGISRSFVFADKLLVVMVFFVSKNYCRFPLPVLLCTSVRHQWFVLSCLLKFFGNSTPRCLMEGRRTERKSSSGIIKKQRQWRRSYHTSSLAVGFCSTTPPAPLVIKRAGCSSRWCAAVNILVLPSSSKWDDDGASDSSFLGKQIIVPFFGWTV